MAIEFFLNILVKFPSITSKSYIIEPGIRTSAGPGSPLVISALHQSNCLIVVVFRMHTRIDVRGPETLLRKKFVLRAFSGFKYYFEH